MTARGATGTLTARPREGGRGTAAVPQISGHQNGLDGIRAIAALLVLVYHVASTAGLMLDLDGAEWLYNGGQIGVPIFFALSGLLLYRPWAARVLDPRTPKPRTRRYFRKRAVRILPAYWAVVITFMLTAGFTHAAEPWTWVRFLTLTHTYRPDQWWGSNLGPSHLGQMWSLVVEAAFYVTLPATAAVLAWYARRGTAKRGHDVNRLARRLLTGIGVYSALSLVYTAALFYPLYRPHWGLFLPRYLIWFGVGMALAVITVWVRLEPNGAAARVSRTVVASWGTCWTAAALAYIISSTPLTGPMDLVSHDDIWTSTLELPLNGLCAAALVAPVALAPAGHPTIESILGNRVMRFLGKISYSIFLWQMLIIVAWFETTGRLWRGDMVADLPLMLVATIAAATAGYYLVERPAQRLARPRRPRRPKPGKPKPEKPKAKPAKAKTSKPKAPAPVPALPAARLTAPDPLPALPPEQAQDGQEAPVPPDDDPAPAPAQGRPASAPAQAQAPERSPARETEEAAEAEPRAEATTATDADPAPDAASATGADPAAAPPDGPSSARSTLPDPPHRPGGDATAPAPPGS